MMTFEEWKNSIPIDETYLHLNSDAWNSLGPEEADTNEIPTEVFGHLEDVGGGPYSSHDELLADLKQAAIKAGVCHEETP